MTPSFDVSPERITVFEVGDAYLFKHYFERTDIFERLKRYYVSDEYRFEIPADEYEGVREELREEYYELHVAEDPAAYCVVKEKYTTHADILRKSVVHWERRGHLFFLMKDDVSVERAVERGATRLDETDFVMGI